MMFLSYLILSISFLISVSGFAPTPLKSVRSRSSLSADKAAKEVTGEELELMLEDWEQPLVLDAYATWVRFISKTVCLNTIIKLLTQVSSLPMIKVRPVSSYGPSF